MTHLLSRRVAVSGIAGAFALAAAGHVRSQGAGLSVDHAQGRVTLPSAPKRVAVYDLAALDILQALGVDVVGVPETNLPSYLSAYEAERYAKIGTLFEPDYDALRAARPDLIIVSGRSSAKLPELNRIAPTVDLSTRNNAFVSSVAQNVLLLGRLFGRVPEAAAKTEQLLVAVRALQRKGETAGKGLLMFVAGQGVSPQPPQTRFGIAYELTGIAPALTAADLPPAPPRAPRFAAPAPGTPEANAAEATRRQEAQQQRERLAAQLAQHDPDWLFVLDRNAATGGDAVADEVLANNPAVAKTTAWTKQRVIYLDAPGWYLVGGGLTTLRNSIAQIGAAFDAKR